TPCPERPHELLQRLRRKCLRRSAASAPASSQQQSQSSDLPSSANPKNSKNMTGRGGTMVMVCEDICYSKLDCGPPSSEMDVAACRIRPLKQPDLLVASVYIPPVSAQRQQSDRESGCPLDRIPHSGRAVIGGDFNAHGGWDQHMEEDSRGRAVEEWAARSGLTICNGTNHTRTSPATGKRSSPDISCASGALAETAISSWRTGRDLGSDHLPIFFSIQGHRPTQNKRGPARWNFRKADWRTFSDHLQLALSTPQQEASRTLDQQAAALNEEILRAAHRAILPGSRAGRRAPFWNEKFQSACDAVQEARTTAETTNTPEAMVAYNRARHHAAKTIRTERRACLESKASELNVNSDLYALLRRSEMLLLSIAAQAKGDQHAEVSRVPRRPEDAAIRYEIKAGLRNQTGHLDASEENFSVSELRTALPHGSPQKTTGGACHQIEWRKFQSSPNGLHLYGLGHSRLRRWRLGRLRVPEHTPPCGAPTELRRPHHHRVHPADKYQSALGRRRCRRSVTCFWKEQRSFTRLKSRAHESWIRDQQQTPERPMLVNDYKRPHRGCWRRAAQELTDELDLHTRAPYTAPGPPWTSTDNVVFDLNLADACNRRLPDSIRRTRALEYLASRPVPDLEIWTDGSATEGHRNGRGAAVITTRLWGQPPAFASIRHLDTTHGTSADILTDSQAALLTLMRGPCDQSDPRGAECWSHLCAMQHRIRLTWVPAHVGVEGNERADAAANRAVNLRQEEQAIPLCTAKALIHRSRRRLDRDFWGRSAPWTHPDCISRAEATAVCQLRAGCSSPCAATRHRIGIADSPRCPDCGEPNTESHLLDDCPRGDHARAVHPLDLNDAGGICRFLRVTQLTHPQHRQTQLTHPQQRQTQVAHPQHRQTQLTHPQHRQTQLTHPQHRQTQLTHPQHRQDSAHSPTAPQQTQLTHPQHRQTQLTHPQHRQTQLFLMPALPAAVFAAPVAHQQVAAARCSVEGGRVSPGHRSAADAVRLGLSSDRVEQPVLGDVASELLPGRDGLGRDGRRQHHLKTFQETGRVETQPKRGNRLKLIQENIQEALLNWLSAHTTASSSRMRGFLTDRPATGRLTLDMVEAGVRSLQLEGVIAAQVALQPPVADANEAEVAAEDGDGPVQQHQLEGLLRADLRANGVHRAELLRRQVITVGALDCHEAFGQVLQLELGGGVSARSASPRIPGSVDSVSHGGQSPEFVVLGSKSPLASRGHELQLVGLRGFDLALVHVQVLTYREASSNMDFFCNLRVNLLEPDHAMTQPRRSAWVQVELRVLTLLDAGVAAVESFDCHLRVAGLQDKQFVLRDVLLTLNARPGAAPQWNSGLSSTSSDISAESSPVRLRCTCGCSASWHFHQTGDRAKHRTWSPSPLKYQPCRTLLRARRAPPSEEYSTAKRSSVSTDSAQAVTLPSLCERRATNDSVCASGTRVQVWRFFNELADTFSLKPNGSAVRNLPVAALHRPTFQPESSMLILATSGVRRSGPVHNGGGLWQGLAEPGLHNEIVAVPGLDVELAAGVAVVAVVGAAEANLLVSLLSLETAPSRLTKARILSRPNSSRSLRMQPQQLQPFLGPQEPSQQSQGGPFRRRPQGGCCSQLRNSLQIRDGEQDADAGAAVAAEEPHEAVSAQIGVAELAALPAVHRRVSQPVSSRSPDALDVADEIPAASLVVGVVREAGHGGHLVALVVGIVVELLVPALDELFNKDFVATSRVAAASGQHGGHRWLHKPQWLGADELLVEQLGQLARLPAGLHVGFVVCQGTAVATCRDGHLGDAALAVQRPPAPVDALKCQAAAAVGERALLKVDQCSISRSARPVQAFLMIAQMRQPFESPAALTTLERAFTAVDSLVLNRVRLVSKAAVAVAALVRPLAGVNPTVHLQVALLQEAAATDVAFERPFVRMRHRSEPSFEGLAAVSPIADERSGCRAVLSASVLLQRSGRIERLLALGAGDPDARLIPTLMTKFPVDHSAAAVVHRKVCNDETIFIVFNRSVGIEIWTSSSASDSFNSDEHCSNRNISGYFRGTRSGWKLCGITKPKDDRVEKGEALTVYCSAQVKMLLLRRYVLDKNSANDAYMSFAGISLCVQEPPEPNAYDRSPDSHLSGTVTGAAVSGCAAAGVLLVLLISAAAIRAAKTDKSSAHDSPLPLLAGVDGGQHGRPMAINQAPNNFTRCALIAEFSWACSSRRFCGKDSTVNARFVGMAGWGPVALCMKSKRPLPL
uniref:RNase H domain-containing protein n=1 Tax=Macrostomum lignano TaxID=282301 RepID=A0A1I8I140_9PLAT